LAAVGAYDTEEHEGFERDKGRIEPAPSYLLALELIDSNPGERRMASSPNKLENHAKSN